MKRILFCLLMIAASAHALRADEARVLDGEASKTGMGWRISATVQHADTGWENYADAWRAEDVSGKVLGTRELLHPHVQEQPFTRSLSSVMVPDGTRELILRARCHEHGWSEQSFTLTLR
ncbi:hypothetical protein [Litorisediminicola beolgyonensis]|uniref:Uncharacterized protein n=1 Tax=Litorisediminicola beolgyonensis TaxID=1173614 RepID=A0ABW3ZD24_9RHOB